MTVVASPLRRTLDRRARLAAAERELDRAVERLNQVNAVVAKTVIRLQSELGERRPA